MAILCVSGLSAATVIKSRGVGEIDGEQKIRAVVSDLSPGLGLCRADKHPHASSGSDHGYAGGILSSVLLDTGVEPRASHI